MGNSLQINVVSGRQFKPGLVGIRNSRPLKDSKDECSFRTIHKTEKDGLLALQKLFMKYVKKISTDMTPSGKVARRDQIRVLRIASFPPKIFVGMTVDTMREDD